MRLVTRKMNPNENHRSPGRSASPSLKSGTSRRRGNKRVPADTQALTPLTSQEGRSDATAQSGDGSKKQTKRKKHRNRRRRNRRPSFLAPASDDAAAIATEEHDQQGEGEQTGRQTGGESAMPSATLQPPLYKLPGRNLSNTSLESEALLDHR